MSMHGRRVSPREVAVGVIALAWALFHLYTAGFGLLPNLIQRSIHFAGAMVLLCLTLPVLRRGNGLAGTLFNGFLIAVTIVTTAYVVLRYDVIVAMQGQYTTFETVLGFLVLLLVLEGSRRSFGWVFPILVLAFVAYAFFGPLFPGIWAHPGITPGRFADVLYRGTQGLWGFLMSVSATVIAVFILYGNVLLLTGGGEAFFDLAKAVGGRMVGGAAQIATIASAFFGMINGSAVANVATTGNFTIPLMKRLRYETNFAGAVEAVASSGGQFSPPVMGAGAFIMAELLAKPYVQIARAAALPSFLFYVAVMASIYFWARLRRLSPVPRDEIPSWGTALHPLRLVPLVVPVIILLYFLVRGYTAGLAAFWAIVATAVLHVAFALGRERRLSALPEAVAAMGRALREGALSLVPVVMIVAAAQVIVMAINTTGFGTKFAQLIIDIGGQNVLLALVLAMVITTIMGMGAPTPAAYVLVAAVVGPALIRLGLPELPSHLFLYYYACLAAITPPVAPAAFTAVAISGGDWWRTGWEAVRLALSAFIIPFLFVFYPALLLDGSVGEIIAATVSGIVGAVMLSAATMGFLLRPASLFERVVLAVGALGLLQPGLVTDAIGAACLATAVASQLRSGRPSGRRLPVQGEESVG